MILGHGGNVYELARQLGCPPEAILDMSSNVNPLGPPPGLEEHLKAAIAEIRRLPEPDAAGIVRGFADLYALPVDRVVAGNGTTQLIHQLPRALGIRSALILGPTYSDYRDACRASGTPFRFWFAAEVDGFEPDLEALARTAEPWDTVFVCNPNNPTGRLIDPERLLAFCREVPDKRVVIDESYLAFAREGEGNSLMTRLPANALVLHSMSKIFRIPGLRIGFLVADTRWTEALKALSMPWSVNSLAQAAVAHLLGNPGPTRGFVEDCRKRLAQEIQWIARTLAEAVPGLRIFPTFTSFLLMRLPDGHSAARVWASMARQGILIRDCGNFDGLSDRFIRISVQSPEANRRAVAALVRVLSERAQP